MHNRVAEFSSGIGGERRSFIELIESLSLRARAVLADSPSLTSRRESVTLDWTASSLIHTLREAIPGEGSPEPEPGFGAERDVLAADGRLVVADEVVCAKGRRGMQALEKALLLSGLMGVEAPAGPEVARTVWRDGLPTVERETADGGFMMLVAARPEGRAAGQGLAIGTLSRRSAGDELRVVIQVVQPAGGNDSVSDSPDHVLALRFESPRRG